MAGSDNTSSVRTVDGTLVVVLPKDATVQNDFAAALSLVAQRVPATVLLPFHCQFCGKRYDRLANAFDTAARIPTHEHE
jgi:hypothetical protein